MTEAPGAYVFAFLWALSWFAAGYLTGVALHG